MTIDAIDLLSKIMVWVFICAVLLDYAVYRVIKVIRRIKNWKEDEEE